MAARSAWRKEAGWLGHGGRTTWFTDRQQRLAQRQKKLAGGSPGRRIERREKRLDHGGTERRFDGQWRLPSLILGNV